MSSVLSLPQELKLAILLQATNENEPRRNEILRTASLVQTSFRGLSQALLAREIQILDEEQLRPVEDALQQAPFRHIKTHSLQFRGNLESLLAGKGRNRWMELESLRFVTSKNEIDLELVCKLSSKSVRWLQLCSPSQAELCYCQIFVHSTFPTVSSFPYPPAPPFCISPALSSQRISSRRKQLILLPSHSFHELLFPLSDIFPSSNSGRSVLSTISSQSSCQSSRLSRSSNLTLLRSSGF